MIEVRVNLQVIETCEEGLRESRLNEGTLESSGECLTSCCMAKALWIVGFGVLRRSSQNRVWESTAQIVLSVYICIFGRVCLLCPYIGRVQKLAASLAKSKSKPC